MLTGNPVPSNIKEKPILDNNTKQLLLENMRRLTLNHDKAVNGIHDKVSHVFSTFLRFWDIIKEDKEAAL